METPSAVIYSVDIGPYLQPSINNPETVKIKLEAKLYKVLVEDDNPSIAYVWRLINHRWTKQPNRVFLHSRFPDYKKITVDNKKGDREPIYNCDYHNHDSKYRPIGYQCEHIKAAIKCGRMVPREHTTKSYPITTAHVP